MTLIEPFVKDNQLQLDYPGMDSLTIKLPEGKVLDEMERVKVAVWGEPCLGVDLGDQVIINATLNPEQGCFSSKIFGHQVSEWLSDVILCDPEAGMRLLYHPAGDTTRFENQALLHAAHIHLIHIKFT